MQAGAPVLRTVGHGTLGATAFAELVAGAGISVVVDVRRFPGSRRHPHFGRDELARSLPAAGVEYRWMEDLGGRRTAVPHSPNAGLRNAQFRAYADHMASPAFAASVRELVALASSSPVAVMCSEAVWWRCHRRLVADHVILVEDLRVEHLFHDGRITEHPLTPGAHRVDDHVEYRPEDTTTD